MRSLIVPNVVEDVEFRFGTEALFCLLAGNAHDRYIEWDGQPAAKPGSGPGHRDILASRGEMAGVTNVRITDEWLKLRCEVKFPGASRAWRDAIETVSQSEGGYERVYQGTVVIPIWDLKLSAGSEGAASMSIQLREGA